MSFYTALTGLNGAQADISATSNNIANVGTTGFKRSRAEFGDIFATSPLQNASSSIGSGAILKGITQQFTQGNIASSLNALDLAISGQGFFTLKPSVTATQTVYTRNGSFSVNNERYVVDSAGQYLMVYPVNPDGSVTAKDLGSAGPLQLPVTAGDNKATEIINLGVNLPADAEIVPSPENFPDGYEFDPANPDTYTNSTSITIFDDLGNPTIATVYYIKTQNASPEDPTNKYETRLVVNGQVIEPDLVPAVSEAGQQIFIDKFGNQTTQVPLSGYSNENKASPLYRTDTMKTTVPSQPASLRGERSAMQFGDEADRVVEIITDPLYFKATVEGGNRDATDVYWGRDFLLINVDDGSEPVSVDIRPGRYNPAQLAAEVERAINAAYGDDKFVQVSKATDGKLTIDLINVTDGVPTPLANKIEVDLFQDSYALGEYTFNSPEGEITDSRLNLKREDFLAHAQLRINEGLDGYIMSGGTVDANKITALRLNNTNALFTREVGTAITAFPPQPEIVNITRALPSTSLEVEEPTPSTAKNGVLSDVVTSGYTKGANTTVLTLTEDVTLGTLTPAIALAESSAAAGSGNLTFKIDGQTITVALADTDKTVAAIGTKIATAITAAVTAKTISGVSAAADATTGVVTLTRTTPSLTGAYDGTQGKSDDYLLTIASPAQGAKLVVDIPVPGGSTTKTVSVTLNATTGATVASAANALAAAIRDADIPGYAAKVDSDGKVRIERSSTTDHFLVSTSPQLKPTLKVFDTKADILSVSGATTGIITLTVGKDLTAFSSITLAGTGFPELNGKEFPIVGTPTATTISIDIGDAQITSSFAQSIDVYAKPSTTVEAFFEGADVGVAGVHQPYSTKKIVVRETGAAANRTAETGANPQGVFTFANGTTSATSKLGLNVTSVRTSWVDELNPPIKVAYNEVGQNLEFSANPIILGSAGAGFSALTVYSQQINSGSTNLGIPAPTSRKEALIVGDTVLSTEAFVSQGNDISANKRYGITVDYDNETRAFTISSGSTGEAIAANYAVGVTSAQRASNVQVGRRDIPLDGSRALKDTGREIVARNIKTIGAGTNALFGFGASVSDGVSFIDGKGLASKPALAVGGAAQIPLANAFRLTSTNGENVFNVSVDGVSATIVLPPRTYAGSTLASALQERINQMSDPITGKTIGGVTVRYNPTSNNLTFTTGTTGINSTIKVSGPARFGLDDVPLGIGSVPEIFDLQQAVNERGELLFVDPQGKVTTAQPDDSELVSDYYPLYIKEGELTFDKGGRLISPKNLVGYEEQLEGASITLKVDYSASTQLAQPFGVINISQDGFTAGRLDGLEIDSSGTIRANYTNGDNNPLGKIVIANFNNQNGLKQVGNATYVETAISGPPTVGEAGAEGFGTILSGSLERSNVDITEELVNLITAQRNYQASAKAIETTTSLNQTIINIRQ